MPQEHPRPALYGIETECSYMITSTDGEVEEIVGECHSIDTALDLFQAPDGRGIDNVTDDDQKKAIVSTGLIRNKNGMLSNGGRLYIDPSGIEYDTPEVTTAEEAVIRTFDGDELVMQILRNLQERGAIEAFQFNRRIVDHNRQSRGIHLNNVTNLPAETPSAPEIRRLATLNIVKGALCGSGGLLLNPEGQTEFHHSPRLSLTDKEFDDWQNYRARPLVRVPFKPDTSDHDGTPLSRVETVSGDALNFAWPMRASLILTDVTLRLIELGQTHKLPAVRDHELVWAAQAVGKHGNAAPIVYDIGHTRRSDRPSAVIREICELALSMDDRTGFLLPEAQQVLEEVYDVTVRMELDIYSVAHQVESIARLMTMKRKMDKDGLALYSERMCRFDYAWDKVGGGIAEILRNRGVGWHGFSVDSRNRKQKQRLTPPTDTRAKARGDFIRDMRGHDNSTWSAMGIGNARINIHPFDPERPMRFKTIDEPIPINDEEDDIPPEFGDGDDMMWGS